MAILRIYAVGLIAWIGFCFLWIARLSAREVFIVPTNASAATPYTNWAMAATNIQNAINAATNNDTVWISNGVYQLTNQVTFSSASNNNMIIKSVNGPAVTVIDANNYSGKPVTNRCLDIGTASNNTFSGLTFANGQSTRSGAGISFAQATTITNCVFVSNVCIISSWVTGGGLNGTNGIIKNSAFHDNQAERGGGLCMWGATFLISDCTISNNIANLAGGAGIYGNGMMLNSIVISNLAIGSQGGGLGIFQSAVVSNCVISGNVCTNTATWENGAGIYFAAGNATVQNCTIRGNIGYRGGGVFYNQCSNSTIRNCLISGNTANRYGGGIFIYENVAYTGLVESCTIVDNTCSSQGGGIQIDYNTTNRVYILNTIIWSNISIGGSSYSNLNSTDTNAFAYCCAPVNFFRPNAGNVTNYPQFVDFTNGNYRLNQSSPCVNAGTNMNWMSGAVDLDGHSRIDRFSGVVDMGCYEYLPAGTVYSVP